MAIAFVKDFTGSDAFASSFNITVPAGGVAAGNTLIISLACADSSFTVSSITDSSSNSYNLNRVSSSFGSYVLLVCDAHITTALNASDTISVTLGGATGGSAIVSEFSGIAAASFLDQTQNNVVVFDTAHTSNATATTAQADELVFGSHVTNDTSVTWTPDSPFTSNEADVYFSAWKQIVQYKVVSATGTYASTGTTSADCETANVVLTYKADAGAPTGSSTFPITFTADTVGSPGPVALDASTESVRTGTQDPYTFNHTGRAEANGGIQGVIVTAIHGTSSTDHVSTVTYGGVSMSRVIRATDTVTEPGAAEIWFLGTGLSGKGGTQTISADLTSATTDDIEFCAITLVTNDGSDIEVIDSDSISENATNPSVTLQYGGRYAISIGALYGGGAAPSSFVPNGNCTEVTSEDLGAFYAFVLRQTTPGTSDFAIGGTAATDDVAYVAAAFAKVIPSGFSYPLQRRSNAHLLAR